MAEKIKLKEKIAYGFGDAASSMFWKIFGMYSLFFYTDVFGITAAAAGTMFLVARLWDSFFDVFVGIVMLGQVMILQKLLFGQTHYR
jgi:GPH family glycoside/pentoside/hexuronide:cation symporter